MNIMYPGGDTVEQHIHILGGILIEYQLLHNHVHQPRVCFFMCFRETAKISCGSTKHWRYQPNCEGRNASNNKNAMVFRVEMP